MKRKPPITHKELGIAIQRFMDLGGFVKRLPPEIIPVSRGVGGHYGRYEPLGYYTRTESLSL